MDRLVFIDNNWNEFTEEEYYITVRKLLEERLEPITNGFYYNQTDIKNLIKTK